MPLRSFAGNDGTVWRVWRVESPEEHINALHPGHSRVWLAFQNAGGTERWRLFDVPDDWERLTDERLDALRTMAEPVKGLRRPSAAADGWYAERSADLDIDR